MRNHEVPVLKMTAEHPAPVNSHSLDMISISVNSALRNTVVTVHKSAQHPLAVHCEYKKEKKRKEKKKPDLHATLLCKLETRCQPAPQTIANIAPANH